MKSAWDGDWLARLSQRIHDHGFASMAAFAASMASATLSELAAVLGDDIAPIQVEWLLHMEAEDSGTLEAFARDLLVRSLRERIPDGWGISTNYVFDFRRASAYGLWKSAMAPEHHAPADEAWHALRATDIPDGWLPEGPDDPIIERAFAGVRFDAPDADG